MQNSLKLEKANHSPDCSSNIYPNQSQFPAASPKSSCANTLTVGSSSKTSVPPSSTPMTVNSFKKPLSSTKMDIFVPSPDYSSHFSTSSPSSIYDHDRSHQSSFCGSSMFSNPSIDSDEVYILDDNMEDGCLETYLTPDVMNSFNQTTTLNSSSEFLWAGKLTHDVSMPAISDSLSPNPSLAQLDMEPDISFVNDMINVDQDDSKLNYSVIDLLWSDMNVVNQPTFTSAPSNSPGMSVCFPSAFADSKRNSDTAKTSNDTIIEQKSAAIVSNNNVNTIFVPGSDLPRATKPQLVGVATVIKPEVKESYTQIDNADENLKKLKTQSPNFYKLFNVKDPMMEIKTENSAKDVCGGESEIKWPKDISAQIVPSSSAIKRTHAGIIKTEPMSPKVEPKFVSKEETMEEKWKDVKHFMHSPGEQSRKKARCESGSSEQISDDDDDDDDSSLYGDRDAYIDSDDDYSDIDADLAHISPSECESLVAVGEKQKQYFWQYNVQSKGPKGTRLKLSVESPSDPHVLNDFEDPVFDECNTAIAGIRHGGKARKGDGNEITPNPRKLFMIGHQLLRLNRQINACQLGNDVPAARRNESRKEKNKLASRACRLKKKAQHEANKIKLYGLEQEHSQLNSVLQFIWPHIQEKTKVILRQTDKSALPSTSTTLTSTLKSQIHDNLSSSVAGHTTEFVNNVIIKVESGDNSGGLNIKRNHKT